MKTETREHGDYLLRIREGRWTTRYTLAGKKQLLDFCIFPDGARTDVEPKKQRDPRLIPTEWRKG